MQIHSSRGPRCWKTRSQAARGRGWSDPAAKGSVSGSGLRGGGRTTCLSSCGGRGGGAGPRGQLRRGPPLPGRTARRPPRFSFSPEPPRAGRRPFRASPGASSSLSDVPEESESESESEEDEEVSGTRSSSWHMRLKRSSFSLCGDGDGTAGPSAEAKGGFGFFFRCLSRPPFTFFLGVGGSFPASLSFLLGGPGTSSGGGPAGKGPLRLGGGGGSGGSSVSFHPLPRLAPSSPLSALRRPGPSPESLLVRPSWVQRGHSQQLGISALMTPSAFPIFRQPGWTISLQIVHSMRLKPNFSSSPSTVSSFPASPHKRHTAVCGSTGAVHCRSRHDCFMRPGPPNFFMSRQKWQSPHSVRTQARQRRQRVRRRRAPAPGPRLLDDIGGVSNAEGSHVSREPSLPSRQLPAGRRPSAAGGPGGAGRGTLRTPGSTAPRGRSAPPSGGGRDGGEWRWGAPGARPSHGLRRGPSRGRSCSGGLSPSAPPGQRGLLGRRVLSFCPGPTQSGVRVTAPLPPLRLSPAPPAL